MENMCPGFQGGGESMYVRACARTYICLALQKCQCVRSIFKRVGQLWRVLWNVLLSVLLHFRSVAIVAKWWCQSRSIGIKTTPPPFFQRKSRFVQDGKYCAVSQAQISPKAEQALASHTKMCSNGTHLYTLACSFSRWQPYRCVLRENRVSPDKILIL